MIRVCAFNVFAQTKQLSAQKRFFVRPPDNPAAGPSLIFGVTKRRLYGQTRQKECHRLGPQGATGHDENHAFPAFKHS